MRPGKCLSSRKKRPSASLLPGGGGPGSELGAGPSGRLVQGKERHQAEKKEKKENGREPVTQAGKGRRPISMQNLRGEKKKLVLILSRKGEKKKPEASCANAVGIDIKPGESQKKAVLEKNTEKKPRPQSRCGGRHDSWLFWGERRGIWEGRKRK